MSKVKARKFIVMVHVLHKVGIGLSPGGRTDIVSNKKKTRAKMASTACVKEEPATDGMAARHKDDITNVKSYALIFSSHNFFLIILIKHLFR